MPGGRGSRGTAPQDLRGIHSYLNLPCEGEVPLFRAKFKKSYGHNNYVCNLRPLSIKSPQS